MQALPSANSAYSLQSDTLDRGAVWLLTLRRRRAYWPDAKLERALRRGRRRRISAPGRSIQHTLRSYPRAFMMLH